MDATTPSARLAARADAISFDAIPEAVRRRAVVVAADTLAIAWAGADDGLIAPYTRALLDGAGAGPSGVVRTGRRAPADLAAFLNALPTTVLQMDEGHRRSRSHPAIHVVPAAAAVAEEVDAPGDRLVEALVAGYEVAARAGLLLAPLRPGVHPHGTAGALGAAVAAGKLLGADRGELEAIIDCAATMPLLPSYDSAISGRTIHHLHAAVGVEIGLKAARAALAGATSLPSAVASHFAPMLSDPEGSWDGRAAWDADGYELAQGYLKFHPACADIHTSIEAVGGIVARSGVGPQDVAGIEVHTYEAASRLDDPEPDSNLAARFSIPFCLALVLLEGQVPPRVLGPEDLAKPRTRDLARRIRVHSRADLDAGYPRLRPAEVELTTHDGRTFSAAESLPRGDADRPEPEESWRRKLSALLGDRRAERLAGLVGAPATSWRATELVAAVNDG